jgi:hypothetical protein
VFQQKIVAGIEFVRLGQAKTRAEKVGHGTAAEPVAVQFPFAARPSVSLASAKLTETPGRDEPIRHRHLQDLVPPCPLAARRQAIALALPFHAGQAIAPAYFLVPAAS